MGAVRIVIDGMNVAHIMRHVHKQLRANICKPDGSVEPLYTGVLFGTLRLLDTLMEQFNPVEIIFVWEGDASTAWRRKIYPQYKMNRDTTHTQMTPNEKHEMQIFRLQMLPDLQKCLRRLGIPQIQVAELEADDVIGLMAFHARNAAPQEPNLMIVSTDADYVQCVHANRVRVYNPCTHNMYFQSESGALYCGASAKQFAPSPRVYLWRKAMIGDPSDNLKGVVGVGASKAAALFPLPEETSKETLLEYVQRVAATNKDPDYLKHVRSLLTELRRALVLVDISQEYMFHGLASLRGQDRSTIRDTFLQMTYDAYVKSVSACRFECKQERPVFLTQPIDRDPSPAYVFFRRRDLSVSYYPSDFVGMLRKYEVLWEWKMKQKKTYLKTT